MVDLLASGPLPFADIGAGAGQVMHEFEGAHDGPVFGVGCEYSSEFVEAGRRAGRDLRHGGPEQITGDAPFDLVILSHVVEHFPDPVRDLTAVRALGHGHTLFYVEVPGLLTIDRKPEYAYRLDQYLTVAHTFHFTRATLAATMARAGFAEVRADENIHAVFRTAAVVIPARDPDHAAVVMGEHRSPEHVAGAIEECATAGSSAPRGDRQVAASWWRRAGDPAPTMTAGRMTWQFSGPDASETSRLQTQPLETRRADRERWRPE